MYTCQTCKTDMKTLFTGWYCPNDCDRPKMANSPNHEFGDHPKYGKFLFQAKHPVTNRMWSVYHATVPIDNNVWFGWATDLIRMEDSSVSGIDWAGFSAKKMGIFGMIKTGSRTQTVLDELANDGEGMMRFIPLHPEDREKFSEYL